MKETKNDSFKTWNKCKECGKPAYTSTGVKCGLCAWGIKPEQKFDLYANGESITTPYELMEKSRNMWRQTAKREMIVILILCASLIVLGLLNV